MLRYPPRHRSQGTIWILARGADGGVSFQQYVRQRTDGSRHLFYIVILVSLEPIRPALNIHSVAVTFMSDTDAPQR